MAMARSAPRGPLPPPSKAHSAAREEQQNKGSERHPKPSPRIRVLLHGVEIIRLFAHVNVEGDVDGECDEGEEGCEEGDEGGDEGDGDVFGEGEEEGEEDECCCDWVEDEAARPGGADGLDVAGVSAELGEF